jgi:transcriptional regulator GlxA family with amidase domain
MTSRSSGSTGGVGVQETTFERHYAVDELAELWGMSDDFVRRLFLNEPGVVVFFKYRPGRRTYRTLRIPESVAERVHRRLRKHEA